MISTPHTKKTPYLLYWFALTYAGTGLTVLADLTTSIQNAQTALALGDQILSNVFDAISTEIHYNPGSFFSTQGNPLIRSYKLPNTEAFGIGDMNPIE